MNIVNRRNAIIGYLALQALKRARRNATVGYLAAAAQGMERTRARRSNRRAVRIALYVLAGIVSFGALAAARRFVASRKQGTALTLDTVGEATSAPEAAEPAADDATPAETEPVAAT